MRTQRLRGGVPNEEGVLSADCCPRNRETTRVDRDRLCRAVHRTRLFPDGFVVAERHTKRIGGARADAAKPNPFGPR